MTYEGLRLKLQKVWRKGLASYRLRKLNITDFTIISNNCWGGMIYESYGLPKQSPTVGLFFMASDYIKFVSNLREYLSADLTFIRPEDSKWKAMPQIAGDKRFGSYPIGVLSLGNDDSVEIFFLHYHSEQEARDKWIRRCRRVNWDKLLLKFNDQNGCTEREITEFMKLPFDNKLFFTCRKRNINDKGFKHNCNTIYIKQWRNNDSIMASYEPFGRSRYIDISRIINSL